LSKRWDFTSYVNLEHAITYMVGYTYTLYWYVANVSHCVKTSVEVLYTVTLRGKETSPPTPLPIWKAKCV